MAEARRLGRLTDLKDRSVPSPPSIDESIVRQVEHDDVKKLWGRFVQKLQALEDKAYRVRDRTEAREFLHQQIQDKDLTSGMADPDVFSFLEIENDTLGPLHLDRPGDREKIFSVQFGITMCDLAAAETGTIIVSNGNGRARMTSLAPPIHYAILPMSKLVPDLVDVQRIVGNVSSSCTVWITGSSRTADIASIMIHGMHGPAELTVIGVEDE